MARRKDRKRPLERATTFCRYSLSGGTSYRLSLPAHIPVNNFWSVTVYDAATASGLDNGQPFPSVSSFDKPVRNPDGSTDIYFGPTAPKGFEKNWIPSAPGRTWFAYFRLYVPTEAHFNRTWILPDFEKAK